MFVDLTPEQHALRLKVRDYFQNLMTPELRQQMRGTEGGSCFAAPSRKSVAMAGGRLAQGLWRAGLWPDRAIDFL